MTMTPDETVRIQVTMPAVSLQLIDAHRKALGQSRSEFLRSSALARIAATGPTVAPAVPVDEPSPRLSERLQRLSARHQRVMREINVARSLVAHLGEGRALLATDGDRLRSSDGIEPNIRLDRVAVTVMAMADPVIDEGAFRCTIDARLSDRFSPEVTGFGDTPLEAFDAAIAVIKRIAAKNAATFRMIESSL